MQSPEELARENDCGNIGDQTLIPPSRDQQFVTPDDGRKFTELYNVQHLQWSQREAVRHGREARRVNSWGRIDQSAQLDRVSRVCISTIQRLYSMLSSFVLWDRNTDAARRDQREQTGRALRAWHDLVATVCVRSTIPDLYPK